MQFDQSEVDFKLSKTLKFKNMNLMKDLIQLKNLYPENFKIKEPPQEIEIKPKYSGKAYL